MIPKGVAWTLLALAAPAAGQGADIIAAMAGGWRLLPVDGRRGCGIRLSPDKAGRDWRAIPDAACARTVPAAAAVARWRPTDGMQLLDAQGRLRLAFEEDETTLLRSPTIRDPRLYLVPAGAGLTRAPVPARLTGAWTLARRGRPPCRITLAPAAVAPRDRHPLRLARPCAGIGLPGRLAWWRLEELTLLLEGPNDAGLAFDAAADDRFDGQDDGWRLVRGG